MKQEFDYYRDAISEPDKNQSVWIVGIKRPYYPEVYFYCSESEAKSAYRQLIREEDEKENGIHDTIVFMSKGMDVENIQTVH